MILKNNREVLEGRPKIIKEARSATMVYSYKYTLARRAIIATFDFSAQDLALFESDHWLSSEQNVIQLKLETKAWVEPPVAVVPLPNFDTAPGGADEPRARRPRVGPGPNTPAH